MEFAQRARLLHRRLQPPDAVPRHAALPPAGSARGGCSTTRWWLDERYSYNKIPFRPARMSAEERAALLPRGAAARSTPGRASLRRRLDAVNRADGFMFRNFFLINGMHARRRRACATTIRWETKHGTDRCCARTEPTRRPLRTPVRRAASQVSRTTNRCAGFCANTLCRAKSVLTLEREPDSAIASEIEGDVHQTLVAHGSGNGGDRWDRQPRGA